MLRLKNWIAGAFAIACVVVVAFVITDWTPQSAQSSTARHMPLAAGIGGGGGLSGNTPSSTTPGVPDAGTTDASTVVLTGNVADGSVYWGAAASGGGTSVTWAGDLNGSSNTTQVVTGITGVDGGIGIAATIGGKSGSNPLTLTTAAITVSGPTITLTSTQYSSPRILLQGTPPVNATVIFPAVSGACWFIDATNLVLTTFTVTLQANGVNWGTTIANNTNDYFVCYGKAKLYGITLTP